MKKKIKVLMPSEIPKLNEFVDIYSIEQNLNKYSEVITSHININDLKDWQLLVNVLTQRSDKIAISKRVGRFPSDKECEIYISIPIPDDEQAIFGLTIVKEAFFKVSDEKYSYLLDPGFNDYNSFDSYIYESSKRAIDLIFTKGFTFNGKKIIFQK